MVSSWWNHEIVTKNRQISSVSGRIIDQKVKFLGKKEITIDNKIFKTLNFHVFSNDDKPMKDKKINIKIWYDIDTLIWTKASYQKLGNWVITQRGAYKKGSLSKEKIKELEKIGFIWDAEKNQYNLMFKSLLEYKNK